MTTTDPASEHLRPTVTERGFQHMPPLVGEMDIVKVYESSKASGPHVWLGIVQRDQDEATAMAAHLDADLAWKLHEQLGWLLEHHYQGDARPTGAQAGTSHLVA